MTLCCLVFIVVDVMVCTRLRRYDADNVVIDMLFCRRHRRCGAVIVMFDVVVLSSSTLTSSVCYCSSKSTLLFCVYCHRR